MLQQLTNEKAGGERRQREVVAIFGDVKEGSRRGGKGRNRQLVTREKNGGSRDLQAEDKEKLRMLRRWIGSGGCLIS